MAWKKYLAIVLGVCMLVGCDSARSDKSPKGESIQERDGFHIMDKKILGYTGDAKELRTPEDMEVIGSDAFSSDMGNGEQLESITITSNIQSIEERAFAFTCADYIYMEPGVKKIGAEAFMDSYIKEIWIPDSVQEIGAGILETEEGQQELKIHVVKESKAAKYFEENMPYGQCELCYDYQERR